MSAGDPPFSAISVFDADYVPLPEDPFDWLPLRRRLGISAFGTNVYRAARAGDAVIEDHVESPGQEELYVVLAGRAQLGQEETALEELRLAIEASPALRERARDEDQLATLRSAEGWDSVIG